MNLMQRLADARAAGWQQWIRSEQDERAVGDGCWFDISAAERVRTFFRQFLRHSKGQWAKRPFELLEWQWEGIVAPLFGWKRADGTRRFRRGYIEVPKKNGKSTLFSGLSLYLLAGDREPGAGNYSAAVDRDQASIVYNEAANMVEASPALSSRLQTVRSTRRITFHKTRSFYKALSAEVPAKKGLNAHAVLIDEFHAQKTRDLWDTLRYAGASRFGITVNPEQFAEDCREAQESLAKENSLLPFFWVPEEGARRRAKRDRVPYDEWIREEYIESTPGEAVDYDRIRARINELGELYNIRSIAINRWNATQLAMQLDGDGFQIVPFGQGFASMSWPTKKLDELVRAGRIRHAGHPVLRWMAGNVSIETDAADNWKPSKKKSRERIDGIVALLMGLDGASRNLPSVYEKRGPLFITVDDVWKDERWVPPGEEDD